MTTTYKKLSQIEHVLLRADTYIGSKEPEEIETFVLDAENHFCEGKVSVVQGFLKIIDEIVTNAADNAMRSDTKTDTIKVDVDTATGSITVWNNGIGIPVQLHPTEGIYNVELVFGHLLAGSNFDDSESRTGAGRNGYGSKLTNIYSTVFSVKTYDSAAGKMYTQTWKNNMGDCGAPKITESTGKKDFTQVSFKPDLAKLNASFDNDSTAMIKKRVFDLAACLSCVNPKFKVLYFFDFTVTFPHYVLSLLSFATLGLPRYVGHCRSSTTAPESQFLPLKTTLVFTLVVLRLSWNHAPGGASALL